ncbi:MAG: NnrS family protein [Betaproteobacteria bacterium]|nr:NnrS family protein [Betaproteobacteria bacterium]
MPSLWSTLTAAPHRVMFLPGALQTVAVMLWWMLDLTLRQAGEAPVPGPILHAWWMLFGVFPFFIFGFLFTAAPNWLNGPAIARPVYGASALLMTLGVALVHASLALPTLLAPGLALHLAGWITALAGLLHTLRAAPAQDKLHAALAVAAAGLGGLGAAAFLVWTVAGWPNALPLALRLGVWGFLAPVFLVVCHRMIPWFTSRVVNNYVLIRPYAPLWALLAACLAHALLEPWRALTWLADLPLAGIVFWFAARWGVARGVRQAPLLAMLFIAFLWAGAAFALYAADSLAALAGWTWNAGRAPVHALGIGFFATMLVAMASRVSLGHSGRKLEADTLTQALFWLVQAVALIRMTPELTGVQSEGWNLAAGGLWLLGFGLWAGRYAPMYWRARVDGKTG